MYFMTAYEVTVLLFRSTAMRFPIPTKARLAAVSLISGATILSFVALAQLSSNFLTNLTGLPWG